MNSNTFLEQIYRGTLDKRIFQSFRVVQDRTKIDRLMARFRDLLDEYPAVTLEDEETIPEGMLRRMGDIGLFGVSIPEEYGGLGFNIWEYMRIVEEMVKLDITVAIVSIAHCSIGVKGIQLFGNETQKQKYLKPAATGNVIFSYALTEPRIGSDAQRIETRAELSPDGRHYILNGEKAYITNANYAGALTVFAQTDSRRPGLMGAFIVETGWEGVKVGKDMPKMGLKASSTAPIRFRNVQVPVENRLGNPTEGFKIAMTVLNYGRLGLGAASVGMMNSSLRDMLKRSSTRIQFQVPINSFPLIQEKLVRARVNSTVSSAMNDFVAFILNETPLMNTAVETSHCKLFGTTRAWDTLYDALQVAGGAGYLATQPYEKRMRDFRVSTVFEGTTEIHSIYPALFLLRSMNKQPGMTLKDPLKSLPLLKSLLGLSRWDVKFDAKLMNEALRLARRNAKTIARLLVGFSLVYGGKVFEKEFLLRRISTLSLYLFGLLCLLAKMAGQSRTGAVGKDDLHILAYFLEEAKQARKANRWFIDSRKEILNGAVFRDLPAGWKAGKEQPPAPDRGIASDR